MRTMNPTRIHFWLARVALLALLLSGLAACSAIDAVSATRQGSAEGAGQQTGRTPESTLRTFLEAWNRQDYQAMYTLVSPRSGVTYSFNTFSELYEETATVFTLDAVSYEIHSTRIQGTSAAIRYDVRFETEVFGEIEDMDRTIHIVQEAGGWQIAWSPMDVINGMTSNVTLTPDRRFAPRANIYDVEGRPLVQQNGRLYSLYIREADIRDTDGCIDLLATTMLRPSSWFVSLFADYLPDAYFYVGEIDPARYEARETDFNNLCGMNIDAPFLGSKVRQIAGRNYYGHGAATHITGYVGRVPSDSLSFWQAQGYASTDLVGLTGIENEYERQLAGRPEQFLRLVDSTGASLRELATARGEPPVPVTLTVDREMQLLLAESFNDAWNASTLDWASVATGGAGVVLDVETAAVRALFSYPTFDPRIFNPTSTYSQNIERELQWATRGNPFLPVGSALSNRAISEQYAPGSTFKIISLLAAADADIWQPNEMFQCDLFWYGNRYGDTQEVREDWRVVLEYPPAGRISMAQALTTSCNPFFWEVGGLMFQQSSNLLAEYSQRFGMGVRTGLSELGYNEAAGVIPQPNSATVALNNVIGQGDTQVTTLQMARLVAAVANEGRLYEPYIVAQVGGRDGAPLTTEAEPRMLRELGVTEEALRVTLQGMCDVPVNEELGTAYSVFADASYTSCGKTGTAQTGVAPHSWYVAFAPANDPEIAIAVVVPNSREGSEVAAPIVRRFLDGYFGVEPADWPDWWSTEYVPLAAPQGTLPSSNQTNNDG